MISSRHWKMAHRILIGWLLLLWSSPADAIEATLTEIDGLIHRVEIVSADQNGIMWEGPSSPNPQFLANEKIARIDFPAPALWKQANGFLLRGDYQKAIPAFLSIAGNTRAHFFPAPGNYSSLAMLKLVECYRDTSSFKDIEAIAKKLIATSLNIDDRQQLELVACWIDVGNAKWPDALAKAEAIDSSPLRQSSAEREFIKGLSLENLQKNADAIVAYAATCSLEFGAPSALSKQSFKNGARLLESLESNTRHAELRALIHTYAHVYNEGELWAEANAVERDLLAEELELAPASATNEKDGNDPKSPIIAMRLRQGIIRQRGNDQAIKFDPPLPPSSEQPTPADQLVNLTVVPSLTSTAISMSIKANDAAGISYHRDHGLGVVSAGQSGEDAAINNEGESITFSLGGVDVFRVVSITFGGGGSNYEWDAGDEARLVVTGLGKDQEAYADSISGTIGGDSQLESESDADSPPTAFRRIAVNGGFIRAENGSFQIVHQQGAFGIDAIAIELKLLENGKGDK